MVDSNVECLSDSVKGKIFQLVINNDLELLAVPDECLCNHCRMVFIFNCTFPCGHSYCRNCYDNLLAQHRKCWRCSSEAGPRIIPNNDVEKQISEMKAFCCNKKYGCSHVVSLSDLLAHLEKCDFSNSKFLASLQTIQPSKNDIQPKEEEIDLASRFQDNVINKLKNVSDSMDHLKQLLETKLENMEVERIQFRKSVKRKLDSVIGKNNRSSKKLKFSMKKEMTMVPLSGLKQTPSINGICVWKIDDFAMIKDTISNDEDDDFAELCGDSFYSSEFGYKMKPVVRFCSDHLDVFLQFVPGEHDRDLAPVFRHRRTFTVLDRSDGEVKRDVIRVQEPRFRSESPETWMTNKSGISAMCTYTFLESRFKDVYLKEDSIVLKVVVEPVLPILRNPFSVDGTLIWKVSDYFRTKQNCQDEIHDHVYSDCFYVRQRGHRIQCRLTFDAISLFVRLLFLEGENDDEITGDVLRHDINCSVQSQSARNSLLAIRKFDPSLMSYTEARDRMRSEDCHSVSFRCCDYENSHFLVDESIVIKVVVRPL